MYYITELGSVAESTLVAESTSCSFGRANYVVLTSNSSNVDYCVVIILVSNLRTNSIRSLYFLISSKHTSAIPLGSMFDSLLVTLWMTDIQGQASSMSWKFDSHLRTIVKCLEIIFCSFDCLSMCPTASHRLPSVGMWSGSRLSLSFAHDRTKPDLPMTDGIWLPWMQSIGRWWRESMFRSALTSCYLLNETFTLRFIDGSIHGLIIFTLLAHCLQYIHVSTLITDWLFDWYLESFGMIYCYFDNTHIVTDTVMGIRDYYLSLWRRTDDDGNPIWMDTVITIWNDCLYTIYTSANLQLITYS